MDKRRLAKLQQELITNLNYQDMDHKSLLLTGASFLKQFRQAKQIIRKLTAEDAVTELAHWEFVKNFLFTEIEKVIEEINIRSQVDLEEFSSALLIKFANLVADARATCFIEEVADKAANQKAPKEIQIDLILD